MIPAAEYAKHDAIALAGLVRNGELAASELLEAAIARIEMHNPSLNAVVRKRYEQARTEVAELDPSAPLAGVPFLVKDLIATIAGEPTSEGNRALSSIARRHDSELVRRYRAAGLVIVGRSNTPEFGLTPYTESALFGPARNPWSLEHSPGGSSGGAAAAVAARMVPVASGGDGGGSIRIPASCCGLFGLKPSRGTTPTGPDHGELWRGFTVEHVISRSVRDSAALLDATAGSDPGAPYAAPGRARPFLEEVGRDPEPLRIAFTRKPLFGHHVDAECIAGLEATASLLEALGHGVTEAAPPVDGDACAIAFLTILAAEVRAEIEGAAQLAGRRRPRAADFEAATYSLGLLGRAMGAADYALASRTLQSTARRMAPFFAQYDVLLTPTLGAPPARIGALRPSPAEERVMRIVNAFDAGWLLEKLGLAKVLAKKTFDYIPFTPLFNATGQPAMSVPLHWSAQGLPVGMQFVTRLGADDLLFRLAGQLERARPWFERTAPGY